MRLDELLAPAQTLYVSRKLLNGRDLITWAKSVGIKSLLAPDDMHVTLAYSDKKIVWKGFEHETDKLIVKNDRRSLEIFGESALVLCIQSAALERRWKQIKTELGAKWDYPTYRPHVSLSYDAKGMSLEGLVPYDGELIFGPEVFKENDPD